MFPNRSVVNYHNVAQTLVLCLDFDGCTDTPDARARLINYIIGLLKRKQIYKHIMVVIGSLRQSLDLDIANAARFYYKNNNAYVSCSLLGTDFIARLSDNLLKYFGEDSPTIEFHNLLLSDVLNQLKTGTVFNLMLKNLYADDKIEVINQIGERVVLLETENGEYIYPSCKEYTDQSKTLLTYMFMHEIALKLGWEANFTLLLIDDRTDILHGLTTFYNQNKQLLPFTCFFKCINYNSRDKKIIPLDGTLGTGIINAAYQYNLRNVVNKIEDVSKHKKIKNQLLIEHNTKQSHLFQKMSSIRGAHYFFQHRSFPPTNLALGQNDYHLLDYLERLLQAFKLGYIGAAYALGETYFYLHDYELACHYFEKVILQNHVYGMSRQEKNDFFELVKQINTPEGIILQGRLDIFMERLQPYVGDYALDDYYFCPIEVPDREYGTRAL